MDLDNEELKATREFYRRVKVSPEADKMFEELGYMIRELKTNEYIVYGYRNRVVRGIIEHTISFHNKPKVVLLDGVKGFGIPELKAINQKVKELGWLDE